MARRPRKPEMGISGIIWALILIVWIIYGCIFGTAFMWRNPKANTMSIVREFKNVITFEKMDCYQK